MVVIEEYKGGPRSRKALAMRASGPWSGGVEGGWWEEW